MIKTLKYLLRLVFGSLIFAEGADLISSSVDLGIFISTLQDTAGNNFTESSDEPEDTGDNSEFTPDDFKEIPPDETD